MAELSEARGSRRCDSDVRVRRESHLARTLQDQAHPKIRATFKQLEKDSKREIRKKPIFSRGVPIGTSNRFHGYSQDCISRNVSLVNTRIKM